MFDVGLKGQVRVHLLHAGGKCGQGCRGGMVGSDVELGVISIQWKDIPCRLIMQHVQSEEDGAKD